MLKNNHKSYLWFPMFIFLYSWSDVELDSIFWSSLVWQRQIHGDEAAVLSQTGASRDALRECSSSFYRLRRSIGHMHPLSWRCSGFESPAADGLDAAWAEALLRLCCPLLATGCSYFHRRVRTLKLFKRTTQNPWPLSVLFSNKNVQIHLKKANPPWQ